jgi:hypothetical protein
LQHERELGWIKERENDCACAGECTGIEEGRIERVGEEQGEREKERE